MTILFEFFDNWLLTLLIFIRAIFSCHLCDKDSRPNQVEFSYSSEILLRKGVGNHFQEMATNLISRLVSILSSIQFFYLFCSYVMSDN